MYTIDVKKATTDVTVYVKVIDSTDGSAETGVAYDTSGIDLWYMREGADHTAITEATQTAAGAHSDGGFVHISDGWCRLDLPDAACAAGVDHVYVGGTVTGMIVLGVAINLVDYDPFDSVRMGMTALPNAAADAAGGLPISDAGGLDMDAILADTNELQTDDIPGAIAGLSIPTAAAIVDEWESQSQADPTGFHVNVKEVNGTAQTANDNGADINEILTDTGTTIPGTLTTINGKLDTIDDFLDTEIAAILEDTGTTLPAAISALNNVSTAQVNAEVVDALNVDTYSEPGQGAPTATPTIRQMVHYLYKQWRNKSTVDDDSYDLYADDGTTVDQTATISDDDETFTRGEIGSGA